MREILIMILCFITGYIVAVYVNKKRIAKAKKDIRYVQNKEHKSYIRGYSAGITCINGLEYRGK